MQLMPSPLEGFRCPVSLVTVAIRSILQIWARTNTADEHFSFLVRSGRSPSPAGACPSPFRGNLLFGKDSERVAVQWCEGVRSPLLTPGLLLLPPLLRQSLPWPVLLRLLMAVAVAAAPPAARALVCRGVTPRQLNCFRSRRNQNLGSNSPLPETDT